MVPVFQAIRASPRPTPVPSAGLPGASQALADVTVSNAGSISGANNVGIGSGGAANVVNSGNITGGTSGVGSDTIATVVNTGAIVGKTRQGILGGDEAYVTNSGTVAGGQMGVASNGVAGSQQFRHHRW